MLKEILEKINEAAKVKVKIEKNIYVFDPKRDGRWPFLAKDASRNVENFINEFVNENYFILKNVKNEQVVVVSAEDIAKIPGAGSELNKGNEVKIGRSTFELLKNTYVSGKINRILVEGDIVDEIVAPANLKRISKWVDTKVLKGIEGNAPKEGGKICGYWKMGYPTNWLELVCADDSLDKKEYIFLNQNNGDEQIIDLTNAEYRCLDAKNPQNQISGNARILK